MENRPGQEHRSRQGNVLVFVTLALVALLAFAAWSTETGQAWTAKGQLQAASDSAALAGAGELVDPNAGQPSDPPAAIAAAQSYGAQNHSIGVAITIPAGDIATGSWDVQNRVFTPLPGSTDPEQVRAVKVLGRRDDVANGPVPTVLGRIFGVDDIPVAADAIAYIGFAGLMPPGTALLPIALDCCKISGAACDNDYCEEIAGNPPNPMALIDGPNAGQIVTGLEFHATGDQNACWTVFDSGSPAVSASALQDIVQDGNPVPAGEHPIYLDNGTKTPVIQEINERFEGTGGYSGNPSGTDLDGDGDSDSWLVPLPIMECQNPGPHCASGTPQKIVGVACFDIQEVLVPPASPEKIIKGSLVCPGDPRFSASACGVGFGPGGEVPTIDAQYPVLVR
ncbi:MAG: pilus assembly protein TadG-related protein [Myxococcota bacterium]